MGARKTIRRRRAKNYYLMIDQIDAIDGVVEKFERVAERSLSPSAVARFALDHGLGVARQHFAELARKAQEATP